MPLSTHDAQANVAWLDSDESTESEGISHIQSLVLPNFANSGAVPPLSHQMKPRPMIPTWTMRSKLRQRLPLRTCPSRARKPRVHSKNKGDVLETH